MDWLIFILSVVGGALAGFLTASVAIGRALIERNQIETRLREEKEKIPEDFRPGDWRRGPEETDDIPEVSIGLR